VIERAILYIGPRMKTNFHAAGTLIAGRYSLVELAGRGGMAEVWRADLVGAEGFRRPVALKRILRHLVNSANHRKMFVREAQISATLDHPNIVQVYDFGEDKAGLYIAMEWVEGLTMKDLATLCTVTDVRTSAALVAALGIEVLRGLEAAHENVVVAPDGTARREPIIHRDVSPSNVMLSIRGVAKLADFGLARVLTATGPGALTPAGVVKGKLAYMAPEILRGKPPSVVSDVYSCGVMLWELVCGGRLFAGEGDIVTALVRGTRAVPVRSRRPDVPEALAAAIDRAVDPDPAVRFPSASAFARGLSDALRTVPERTDTSRLAQEITGAVAAWRRHRATAGGVVGDDSVAGAVAAPAGAKADGNLEATASAGEGASQSVHFTFDGKEPGGVAGESGEVEYLPDNVVQSDDPSTHHVLPRGKR
jgi:serine/threonine protein kinase